MTPRVVLRAVAAAAVAGALVATAATVAAAAAPTAGAALGGATRTAASSPSTAAARRPLTILAAVNRDPEFSLLAAALNATGLDGALGNRTASLTLFAPTDGAFTGLAKLLGWKGRTKASVLPYLLTALRTLNGGKDPVPLLASILKYHVAAGGITAKALVAAGGYTPLEGPRVRLSADGKRLIDAAPAVADPALLRTDRLYQNGVVHVIVGVLLPLEVGGKSPARPTKKPATPAKPTKTIAGLATGTPSLSILVQALAAVDLVKVVADAGASLTVFAPTNGAFLALARDLGYGSTKVDGVFAFLVKALTRLGNGDPAPLLKAILTYHVLPTKKGSAALLGTGAQTTVQGGRLLVTPAGEVVDLAPAVGNAKITTADIGATNGVVHLVNRVLLPIKVCPVSARAYCVARRLGLDAKACRCVRRYHYKRHY